jgi:mRNA interferase MazF
VQFSLFVIGLPWGEVRYPMLIVVPLTTQTGLWSRQNPSLYPRLEAGVGGLTQSSVILLDQLRSIDAPYRVFPSAFIWGKKGRSV